jgi:hypothetical protein
MIIYTKPSIAKGKNGFVDGVDAPTNRHRNGGLMPAGAERMKLCITTHVLKKNSQRDMHAML